MELLHDCVLELSDNTRVRVDLIVINSKLEFNDDVQISDAVLKDEVVEHLVLHLSIPQRRTPINTVINNNGTHLIYSSAIGDFTTSLKVLRETVSDEVFFKDTETAFRNLNTRGNCMFGIMDVRTVKESIGIVTWCVMLDRKNDIVV